MALRLDARHVGRVARRHRRVPRRRASTVYFCSPGRAACGCRARSRSWTGCSCSPSSPGARLLARTRDRAARGARPRRARQGGDRRRRRRRGPARSIRRCSAAAQLGYTPIGLVDDDPRKKNLRIHGVRVLGTTDELPHILRDNRPGRGADRDPVRARARCASGSSTSRARRSVPVKTLPGLYELISGDLDLAGADPAGAGRGRARPRAGRGRPRGDRRRTSRARPCSSPAPAARSAPSSAARSRASAPQRLILVDQGETALFEIERELVDERGFAAGDPGARRRARAARRCARSSSATGRRVVFHAAAYKHVPLMEANPLESVRNNVLGDAGRRRGRGRVRRRALRPRLDRQGGQPEDRDGPVEGALRVDRRGLRRAARTSPTRFVAVRFGNVLGSSGSVIPIFRRQIAQGGPVTVTHPEMTRYFMTIPEAVVARRPGRRDRRPRRGVRARHGRAGADRRPRAQMIRLSGKEPERDIDDRVRRRRGRARSCTRSSGARARSPSRPQHPKIMRVTRPDRRRASGSQDELAELERLVARARRSRRSRAWRR